MYRKGVSALIMNERNEFLLVNLMSFDEQYYAVPGGGVNENETLLEAAYREVFEELGIKKEWLEYTGKSDSPLKFKFKTIRLERDGLKYIGSERYFFGYNFIGDLNSIKPQDEEVRTYKWVKYSELDKYLLFDSQVEDTSNKILGIFPCIKYLSLIRKEFELKGELLYKQIHNGSDNNVYIITDKDVKYVLREGKRTGKDISFEIEVLKKLSGENFSAPKIIQTVSGNYYISIDNIQLTLFEYISGTQIEKLNVEHLKSDYISRGAKKLGELHSRTNGMNINTLPNRSIFTEYDRFLKVNKDIISKIKGSDVFIEHVKTYYNEAKLRIESNNELCGVIQNDYRIQNVIYTDDDCYIIDFDWSCNGPFLKDVGLAIAEWSIFSSLNGASKEAVNTFIHNYNLSAPKKIVYDKDLIFWICFACLSDACTFLTDVSENKHPDKNIENVDQCFMYKKFKYFLAN